MLNSTPFKQEITLVAAMKMASLLMDLKTPPWNCFVMHDGPFVAIVSMKLQKLWWVAKVVELVAWKLFLFGDESTHPWHQSVYTQIFLRRRHTFSSLDSFSYQQSQSNIAGYDGDSSRWSDCFLCLCYYSQISSFWKWIEFILEQSKAICLKTQNRWATFAT